MAAAAPAAGQPEGGYWRGMHVMIGSGEAVPALKRLIREALAPLGVNVLVLEVDYNYQFESHPELSQGTLTKEHAGEIAGLCREHGIRVIPLLNCLGHQSWAEKTFTLLTKYPEFDETPDIPPHNPDIYCRSWCPLHPGVNPIAFSLMDELLDAFEADALHVGLDEVFLLASDQCERCKGKDPAELFARAVNDYHGHLVGEKGVEMLMWGDRLLDAQETGYGTWEAAGNGTAPAIDMVPKDIIICDWHYEPLDSYPSVRLFQEKGFRVWPAPWRNVAASRAFIADAKREATEKMLGALGTGWNAGDGGQTLLTVMAGEYTDDEADDLRQVIGVAEVIRDTMEEFGE